MRGERRFVSLWVSLVTKIQFVHECNYERIASDFDEVTPALLDVIEDSGGIVRQQLSQILETGLTRTSERLSETSKARDVNEEDAGGQTEVEGSGRKGGLIVNGRGWMVDGQEMLQYDRSVRDVGLIGNSGDRGRPHEPRQRRQKASE